MFADSADRVRLLLLLTKMLDIESNGLSPPSLKESAYFTLKHKWLCPLAFREIGYLFLLAFSFWRGTWFGVGMDPSFASWRWAAFRGKRARWSTLDYTSARKDLNSILVCVSPVGL